MSNSVFPEVQLYPTRFVFTSHKVWQHNNTNANVAGTYIEGVQLEDKELNIKGKGETVQDAFNAYMVALSKKVKHLENVENCIDTIGSYFRNEE